MKIIRGWIGISNSIRPCIFNCAFYNMLCQSGKTIILKDMFIIIVKTKSLMQNDFKLKIWKGT